MPDEPLIWERAKRGDPDAFATIFDSHRDRVFGHALRLMRSGHDAEDITALVFFEAWRRRTSVRVVNGSVIAWLLVTTNYVAMNATRTAARHRKAMSRIPSPVAEDDHADVVLDRLDTEQRTTRLSQAFAKLSGIDRDVLTLCVVNDFSLAEAAAALAVPVGTVKSRLSRAKQRLASLSGLDDRNDASIPALGDLK